MGENQFLYDYTIFEEGGIKITTNLSSGSTINGNLRFSEYSTLADVEETHMRLTAHPNASLGFDKSNLFNFIKFGNAGFEFESTLSSIISNYPASLYSNGYLNNTSQTGFNIINAAYNPYSDTTSFSLLTNYIKNPMGLDYRGDLQSGLAVAGSDYVVECDGKEYPISQMVLPVTYLNATIRLEVTGKCFDANGNISKDIYIRPKKSVFDAFYSGLPALDSYMLQENFRFYTAETTKDGVVLNYSLSFTFPRHDLYNLDVQSQEYEGFVRSLMGFAQAHDQRYNGLLSQYVPEVLQSDIGEDSASDGNIMLNQMMLVWGHHLDLMHQKIRNLKRINSFSEIPEEYKGLLLKKMGLEVPVADLGAVEMLLEVLPFLWKSKGTMAPLDFISMFFNIPLPLIESKSHYYRTNKIDLDYLKSILPHYGITLNDIPVGEDGYVDVSKLKYPSLASNGCSLSNLLPSLDNYQVTTTEDSTTYDGLFKSESGELMDYRLLNKNLELSLCFDSTGSTVTDPYPTEVPDECGCPLPVEDLVHRIDNSIVSLSGVTGCTPYVLDVVPTLHVVEGIIYTTSETTMVSDTSGYTECPEIAYEFTVSMIASHYNGTFIDSVTLEIDLNLTGNAPVVFTDISLSHSYQPGNPPLIRRINQTNFTDSLVLTMYYPSLTFTNVLFYVQTEFGCTYSVSLPDITISHNLPPVQLKTLTGTATSGTPFTTGETTMIEYTSATTYTCYYDYQFHLYGGTPPYEFVGLQPTGATYEGDMYSVYAVDANGCVSNLVTGETLCPNLCDIQIDLGYTCISGTTGAQLNMEVTGGVPPYEYVGAMDGDIVEHGQTVVVKVVDSNGCESLPVSVTIDCNPDTECTNIGFSSALETTSYSSDDQSSVLTMSYEVQSLPFGVYVDSVDVVATGVGISDNYLVGTPVSTNFNTDFGAHQYLFDFNPDEAGIVGMQFMVSVVLTNGCLYNATYVLSVDARVLSSQQSIQLVL